MRSSARPSAARRRACGTVVPPLVAGAVAVAVGLLITGAFHEDGLGDIADAFGGGWTVERRLEILKDSRHGTYGVAAICASIVLRVVALGSLPGPWAMFTGAVAAHTMGRVAAVALMAGTMRLATHSGLGADYGRGTTRTRGRCQRRWPASPSPRSPSAGGRRRWRRGARRGARPPVRSPAARSAASAATCSAPPNRWPRCLCLVVLTMQAR